jgi:RimJ/RimL family protein N-acetyltransferase
VQEAIPALTRGTKVWLYANRAHDVVVYGSLGLTRWKYPDADSPKTGLVIIPAVAIRRRYWGKPEGVPEDRYSSQIMRYLIAEALAWPGSLPAVGLFVHPDNHAAIRLYERFGFGPFHHVYTDPGSQVTYRSMIRRLARG